MTPPLDATLRIALFGELHVQRDGHPVVARLPGRQGRTLLAYLVLNRSRPVDRDELQDVLWSKRCPADPDAALSSVLAKVRRAVGPDLITGRGVLTLHLPDGADVDVQRVAEQLEQAESALAAEDALTALHAAQSALHVLDQPLLPGLQGDWVDSWRRHFGELKPRALEASARAALALGGDYLAVAERAACAVIEIQPFRETAYALLMEIQACRGDVSEAVRTFERIRTLLRDELGTVPSPEFVALHGRLLHEGASGASEPADTAADGDAPVGLPAPAARAVGEGAFIGREACLTALRKVWDRSRAGQTELVLLVGEPGIGKTRLALEFAEEVHRAGGAALYGRADEDALLPHQPFVEALRPLLVQGTQPVPEEQREILSLLIPELSAPGDLAARTGDQETLRYRLFEAVLDVLTRACGQWPVLLVLDDLHWADKPSLLLLRHLLREPELGNLLVVATFRDVEVGIDHPLSEVLADVRRERSFERMKIEGLEEAETRAFVSDRLGRPVTAGFVRRLREQTEGNAFFIQETLRAVEDADLPSPETVTESSLERVGVPDGVAEVILRRMLNLSALGVEALVAASVIGREFRLGVVEELLDAKPQEVITAVEENIVAGLIREETSQVDVFAFSHAVVREVLYRQLTASRRVRLHHRVAMALEGMAEREAVNPAELAHHFWLARHFAGDGPARRYSIAAAERATKLLAYEEAAAHFCHALELFGDGEDSERCDVLLALGRAQWHAGGETARATFLAAADSASRRGNPEQLAKAAIGLGERWYESAFVDGRYREVLEEAVSTLPREDTASRALLLSRLAQNMGYPYEHERAISMSGEALEIARRLGDDNVLTGALLARHVTLTDVRHLPERLALMEELASVGGEHRELAAEQHHWRLYDLFELGDLEAAERELTKLEGLAAELRQPVLQSLAAHWRGNWAELTGDVELAARCAEEGLRHGRRAHMRNAISDWAAKLFSARRRDDRVNEIMPLVERLANGAGRGTSWPSGLALLHLEAGDEAAARAIYERELAEGPEAVPHGMYRLTTLALLSELCAKLGDADRAEALYTALLPYAHRNIVVAYTFFLGPVDSYLAYLADMRGDRRLASRYLSSALERTRAMGAPLLTAELEERNRELAVT